MAEEQEFKIKGAALRAAEVEEGEVSAVEKASDDDNVLQQGNTIVSVPEAQAKTEGGSTENQNQGEQEDSAKYRWCKCLCDPQQFYGQDHYFLNLDTHESRWEEPNEPYWLWDTEKQTVDDSGLHYPASKQSTSSDVDPEYTGYNPKIHGHYDPTAPYAQYHNKKRDEEAQANQPATTTAFAPGMGAVYDSIGAFNRFSGQFQSGDKNTERHNDFNKSGRQLSAYFDVDAAANAHDGRSLKEERRNEKLSKKQIKELADKRRAKKEKKRMDFYKS